MIHEVRLGEKCQIEELEKSFPQIFVNFSVNDRFAVNEFTKIFTLIENGKCLGFIIVDILYERMEITQICVLEQYRKQGKASQLMEYIIALALDKNLQNITLEVSKENQAALSLYQKYGFQKVAIRKNYYHGIDGILMERKLMKDETNR